MVPNKHKTTVLTFINVALAGDFIILGIYLYFDRSIDNLFHYWFIVGVITYAIYMLVIPESPAWLIMKEGPNS